MNTGLVTAEEMRSAERAAFERGVSADELMELAGAAVARVAARFSHGPGLCRVFFGKGNNGGDALVAARHLVTQGWKIELRGPDDLPDGSLAKTKLAALESALATFPHQNPGKNRVVLDGLLGTGANGAPRPDAAEAIREILNHGRHGERVVAIDIPSGLDADSGMPFDPCVCADVTVTLGFPKRGLVADSATALVGRIEVVPLPGVSFPGDPNWRVASPDWLGPLLPRRDYEAHKGTCGRVAIVAGSPGFTGAARLASAACVRAGAGLVTLFADPESAPILAASCAPEVMVHPTKNLREVLDFPADVLAVGPGVGRRRDAAVLALIRDFAGPAVVDADALNALSGDLGLLRKARGPRLLTPHPGEMERLTSCSGRRRLEWATSFATTYKCFLILKGARSIFVRPDGSGAFNSTGGPGMASGGMGDVLTGVASGLAAQIGIENAGPPAMWACGRAADIAGQTLQSDESLCASDVIANLGPAFQDMHTELPFATKRA